MNVIQLTQQEPEGPALIGSRWRPGHVIRRDTELGTFESVNPPLETMTEALVQRALLAKAKRLTKVRGCSGTVRIAPALTTYKQDFLDSERARLLDRAPA